MTQPAKSARTAKQNPNGVTVARRRTTAGTHPFDQVEWAPRDVVMQNWRTKEVNFEQRGVEFPVSWSEMSGNIVTSKYFRGALGTPEREYSLKQLINRIVDTYTAAGIKEGYFATAADAEAFSDELKYALQTQQFAFNSPVWFNVGTSSPAQVSACYILAVDDSMDSILNWYKEEGMIFKGGSGAGVNLSKIRSSKELLSTGGTASGPVSFMRGADASAGTIKSGGATRRAAKMVVLDVDHPDIVEFIEIKAREEEKIKALREAGFDMDLGGKDIVSVQYQNANNSVRVNDEFMEAVERNGEFRLTARGDGRTIETVKARELFNKMAKAAWECADPGIQYDGEIQRMHTLPNTGRISATNPCSEFVHLDNTSCNLASINLMKFRNPDGSFDLEGFQYLCRLVFIAAEISVSFGHFPTEAIGEGTRKSRPIGLGFANLGALLMSNGVGYDSDLGRAWAGAITSQMTATAYLASSELAKAVGPFEYYDANREEMLAVLSRHRNSAKKLLASTDVSLLSSKQAANLDDLMMSGAQTWDEVLTRGVETGYRNSQATVLAPTGCLTPDTFVTTDRGLSRLGELGDMYGSQWQDANFRVSTDEGPQQATKFFINGEEETRQVVTKAGYQLQGTLTHRIKVVNPVTSAWEWKRLADVVPGDVVPMQLGTLVGEPRRVPLPVLEEAYYAGDRTTVVPDALSEELAELVGYFMGDGSLHAKGIRLCVANTDLDVADRIAVLSKDLFNLEPKTSPQEGYLEVTLQSVRLARWWQAAGFAKVLPHEDHQGKGWTPRVPSAILESNNPAVYNAFIRGLFEADGTVADGVPSFSTASRGFAYELQNLLLVQGYPTTLRATTSGFGGEIFQVRLRNAQYVVRYLAEIGFLSNNKQARLSTELREQTGRKDYVFVPLELWRELAPVGNPLRSAGQALIKSKGGVSRDTAQQLFAQTGDPRLGFLLGYIFEKVAANLDGGIQPTFDLSVPENVTYVAGGFVSHNTIGLVMDCDTTGLEPDLALVKYKKLADGGSIAITNNSVRTALRSLGYEEGAVEEIALHVARTGSILDAPGFDPSHAVVFQTAMGDNLISAMGHVRLMAAVQPFVSGALSKSINLVEDATIEDIAEVYLQGWKLGLKAIAVYRDNCKVGQPLSVGGSKATDKADAAAASLLAGAAQAPVRKRLPKQRTGKTTSFSIDGAEGYVTANAYADGTLGEMFIKMSKQGSTLAGVMDAFSVAISLALQYGVPPEAFVSKFINMRFDPAGMTDDPDVRIASSMMDYLFRRIAIDYLPYETRAEYGIFTIEERKAQVEGGYNAEVSPQEVAAVMAEQGTSAIIEHQSVADHSKSMAKSARAEKMCMKCGVAMQPAGACYVCTSCGETSGCS